jgi:hypothetical protein
MIRPVLGVLGILLLAASLHAQDEGPAPFRIFDKTGFTVGETPTSPSVEIEEIDQEGMGMLDSPEIEAPQRELRRLRQEFEERTGLRLAGFYTMLFQQGTNGPGTLTTGSGDLDLLAQWTFLGRGTPDFGQVIFDAEYRHSIGDLPASALGRQVGTLQGTTHGFNDRGMVIRNFHYIQRLRDGKFGFLIGRADPSDLGGGHAMQNVNTMFVNRAFASASTVAFPGFGFSAGFSLRPVKWYYATVGASNAYGNTIMNDLPQLAQGDFFSFFETGFTPDIPRVGTGRYRFYLWNLDDRGKFALPSDRGFSFIVDQDLSASWQMFARYGWSENGSTGIKSSFETGLGYRDFFGKRGNLAGLAFAVSEAATGGETEKILETFVRFQLTSFLQTTVGLQGIFNPVQSNDTAAAVFTARLRATF